MATQCCDMTLQQADLVGNLADGNLQFALDLYKEFIKRAGDGNVFFSPLSITLALAMTRAGARGNTLAELTIALGLGKFKTEADISSSMADLLNSLTNEVTSPNLLLANRIYIQNSYIVLHDFLETLKDNYGASIDGADFVGNPKLASQQINSWVEQQTANKIKNVVSEDAFGPFTRLVLTNAIYFKGKWVQPFDQTETHDGRFQCKKDHAVTAKFMRIKEKFPFTISEQLKSKILELPYLGDRLSMVLILPDEMFGLAEVESKLSGDLFRDVRASLQSSPKIIVQLPKFKLEAGAELTEILKSLGMNEMFGPKADLSGISSGKGNLYVSSVVHKACVEVNEEGTEAAAATVLTVEPRMLAPQFIADHPFAFVIYDKITDAILFMGRLMQPPADVSNRDEL